MAFTLTPAVKGQITKILNSRPQTSGTRRAAVSGFFERKFNMPREQAKHATRKYLAAV